MNEKREQILAAVKKLGASSPLQISEHTGLSSSLCGYHLRGLVEAGLLKATGTTSSRKYEATDSAPPQERKQKKASAPRPRPAATTTTFLPTVDVDRNLVLINDTAVTRFNDAQTLAIVTLLSQHYEA